ncbi:Rieske [2Fe-2S] domain protein [Pelagimonas phthalicica]|uniref:Rieske [2Fe-2S] domain protein n=2 Tax=Pelagimonas phthalicica TaxID=1037362 RepID=A0A238JIC0_9RHOB|nr:nitrite reductase/ring-hydroxylating ferredoxin subunit [Pelagimonas phthalicica]SMX29897.1 Rieske [2Fe-2S] domain protein [Pelagimonas phthalicica]
MTILCKLLDIPDGGSLGVSPNARGRDQIVLIRKGADVFAYRNNCPHYDRAPLGWKKDEFLNKDQNRIMCAAHGALFRIEDGECVVGPCLGQKLEKLSVGVIGDDVVLNVS